MAASNETGTIGRIASRVGRYVNHDDVFVRFGSLWLVVASVFTTAGVLSYLLLPQGLLRGGNPAASAGYAGSVSREFLTLFGWNVGVSLIAVAANTLRSVNTPLGDVILVVQAPRQGAVWGTGSLAVGTGERIVPSLAVLVERSGPMEITAFVAIVVATRGVMLWHQESGPGGKRIRTGAFPARLVADAPGVGAARRRVRASGGRVLQRGRRDSAGRRVSWTVIGCLPDSALGSRWLC